MDKPVFLDKKSGIIKAESYMTAMLEYLRNYKKIDLFEETELLELTNKKERVTLKLKSNGKVQKISSKKVALTCGRWISKLFPPLKKILNPVRQTISFWKMKNRDKFKIGNHPAWSH